MPKKIQKSNRTKTYHESTKENRKKKITIPTTIDKPPSNIFNSGQKRDLNN